MGDLSFDYQQFGEEIETLAAGGMAASVDAAAVAAVMEGITARAEAALAAVSPPEERAASACAPGCSACCSVNVTVLAPEAIAISHYLRWLLEPPLLEEIRARTAETAEKVRWMEDSERIFRNIPCPFLDGRGWCIIHPVRPLTCRALSSVDAGQCREALDAQFRGEDAPLLVNLRQKLLMDETFRRIAAGLGRQGLDDHGYELTTAVATLLEQPELPERFLAGEPKLLN